MTVRAGRPRAAPGSVSPAALWSVTLGYAAFFALLFFPLLRDGRLPGNCDTWLNGLALPNLMSNRVAGLLTGQDLGTPLYPHTDVFAFGESAFGTSTLFLGIRSVLGDDMLGYDAFVVTLLTLNSVGAFLLARHYVRSVAAAAFAGLAFSASNYTLGNIDSPHTSFFFVAFLCLGQCKRYLATGEPRALLFSAALGGIQIYFSAYVFLFQTAAVLLLLLTHLRVVPGRASAQASTLALSGLILLALVAPFFGFYAVASADPEFVNPWDPTFLAEVHSLEPSDLLRTLENNVLYPGRPIRAGEISQRVQRMIEDGVLRIDSLTREDARLVLGSLSAPDDVKYFVTTRRCAFLGLVLYALAGVGLVTQRRLRWELGLLYGASLLVSFGPLISIGGWQFPGVTYPVYAWLDLAGVLRVPSRAFSFSVLAVVLAAGAGFERLGRWRFLDRPGRRPIVLALVVLAMLAENVPFPLKSFAGASLARPEPLVLDYFAGRRGNVLLDLPSRIGGALFGDSRDLFEWNREILYMNRQTYHRQNVVNGVHGYFPRSRLDVQTLIDALPADEAVAGLRRAGVDYVVYHRTLELPWEGGLYERLTGSRALRIVATSPEVTIFSWSSGVGAHD